MFIPACAMLEALAIELSSEMDEALSAPVSAMKTGPGPEAMAAARSALWVKCENACETTRKKQQMRLDLACDC